MTYAIRRSTVSEIFFWTGSTWREGRSYAREYATEKEAQRELNSYSGERSFDRAIIVPMTTIKKVKVI